MCFGSSIVQFVISALLIFCSFDYFTIVIATHTKVSLHTGVRVNQWQGSAVSSQLFSNSTCWKAEKIEELFKRNPKNTQKRQKNAKIQKRQKKCENPKKTKKCENPKKTKKKKLFACYVDYLNTSRCL